MNDIIVTEKERKWIDATLEKIDVVEGCEHHPSDVQEALDRCDDADRFGDERFECGQEEGYSRGYDEGYAYAKKEELWDSERSMNPHQFQEEVLKIHAILARTGSTAVECKESLEEIYELFKGE